MTHPWRQPTLAAITLHATGGGVAVVADLLWRTVRTTAPAKARLVTMFDHETRPASFREKSIFLTTICSRQMRGATDFVLFSHLGLARVQNSVPDRWRVPYAVFLHGIEAWNPLTPAADLALRRASLLIANSHYTADRVRRAHSGVAAIEVCPLAIPGAENAPPERDTSTSRPTVLVVGRMAAAERYKGHDELLSSWNDVVRRIPSARLIMAGGGDDVPRLRERARAMGLSQSVEFPGFVDQQALETLYRRASIFALPSRGEGFGLVYLEAMSHRLPCVGSRHDAAAEIIVDGETGRLVDLDVPGSLSRVLIELLSDAELRSRCGEAGYRRLHERFAVDRFQQRIQALLLDCAGHRQNAVR